MSIQKTKITYDRDYIPDNSPEWKQFWKNLSPRLRQAAEVGFADGKVGHRFHRPLTAKEQRMLQWAMDLHPGLIFHDDEGRAIGGMLCPCECCQQRTACFVMETGVELQAQQKGDYHYSRTSDTKVRLEECTIGAYENCRELTMASLAGNVALRVAQEVTGEVRTEVQRQLRSFFAEHTRNVTRSMRQDSLIRSAFQTQADMLRSDPDEVQ